MSDEDKKKPFFSEKGNSEDFNYLNENIKMLIFIIIVFGIIFWMVGLGII